MLPGGQPVGLSEAKEGTATNSGSSLDGGKGTFGFDAPRARLARAVADCQNVHLASEVIQRLTQPGP